MNNYFLNIESSWKKILKNEINKEYFKNINMFLKKEINK
jgi:uracil DNA glycosylase